MSKFKILGLLTFLLVLPALGLAQKQSKVPVLNAISPTSATAGGSSLTLTASGSNFTSGSVVQWNGSSIATTVVSSTQLQASVASSRIAGAGTATVKVYTSGRFGGTSNGLTFTTNPAPAAPPPAPPPPPPSPSPLAITTSSVPGGTSGAAYNTPLAASGGTLAYGWSKVSGGGDLPPGLALGADGKLSGTPTTAGTYSFTVQANDSSSTPQTAQKVFSLTVASPPPPPPPSGGYLFSDDFESGNFANWSSVVNPPPNAHGEVTMTSASGQAFAGSNAAKMTHIDTSGNPGHFDIDRYLQKLWSQGVIPDHFFMRTYVKFHFNPGGAGFPDIGRKIIYLNATIANTWRFVLSGGTNIAITHDDTSCGSCGRAEVDTNSNRTGIAAWPSNVGTEDTVQYSLAPDEWYYMEVEIQLNSAGNNDGYERVWVQRIGTDPIPILVIQTHNVNIRHSLGTSLVRFDLGEQVDWALGQIIDEERYIDNFAISTSRIGP